MVQIKESNKKEQNWFLKFMATLYISYDHYSIILKLNLAKLAQSRFQISPVG